jgi:hypoxia up-regulated 1
MKKTPNDVFKNPRALAKLFKEAGRLKNILSANNEFYAQVKFNRCFFTFVADLDC